MGRMLLWTCFDGGKYPSAVWHSIYNRRESRFYYYTVYYFCPHCGDFFRTQGIKNCLGGSSNGSCRYVSALYDRTFFSGQG